MSIDRIDVDTLKRLLSERATRRDICLEESAAEDPISAVSLYLAGPWFDPRAEMLLNYVQDSIWKAMELRVCQYLPYFPKLGGEAGQQAPSDVFNNNVYAIQNCDIILALVDRKDTGTAWEIGMGYALNKKIVLLGYDEDTFLKSKTNLMLALCGHCLTFEQLPDFLTGDLKEEDMIKFNGTNWEGIE